MLTKLCPWCGGSDLQVQEHTHPKIIRCQHCGKDWADTQRALDNISSYVAELSGKNKLTYHEAEDLYQQSLPFDLVGSQLPRDQDIWLRADCPKIVIEILFSADTEVSDLTLPAFPTLDELEDAPGVVRLTLIEKATKRHYDY